MSGEEFTLSILASVIATVICTLFGVFVWSKFKWYLNLPIYKTHPNIKGGWLGTYQKNGKTYEEHIEVENQAFCYFSGKFTDYNETPPLEYKFHGEFTENRNFIVRFDSKDRNKFDIGVSLFSLSNDSNSATGGSASYDFDTSTIETRKYELRKKPALEYT